MGKNEEDIDTESDRIMSDDDDLEKKENHHKYDESSSKDNGSKKYFRFTMASNILFLIGSVLYVWLSEIEYKWSMEAQSIPEHVLLADDDISWIQFPTFTRVDEEGKEERNSNGRFLLTKRMRSKVGGSRLLYQKVSNLFLSQMESDNHNNNNVGQQHRHLQNGTVHRTWEDFITAVADMVNTKNDATDVNVMEEKAAEGESMIVPEESREGNITATNVEYNIFEDATEWNSDHTWAELPKAIQNAAITLGYDEAGTIWNNNGTAPSFDLYWDELTPEEQNGAYTIWGYEEASWNGWHDGIKKWHQFSWVGLPDPVKEAAVLLGYDENSWNKGAASIKEATIWQDLSSEEQAAAILLGHNEETWNGVENIDWGESDGSDNIINDELDANELISLWDTMDWDDVPNEAQEAYEVLGWTKDTWDNGGKAFTDDLHWYQLSSTQQEAASVLGYTQHKWDDSDDSAYDELDANELISLWDTMDWDDLPNEVQEAYGVLGWTKDTLDNGGKAFEDDLHWYQLSSAQQEAASVLGYTQHKWDGSDDSTNDEQETDKDLISLWDTMYWGDLPTEVQEAYGVLGYTNKIWNNDEVPPSEVKSWDELSQEERVAATWLGYQKATWDGYDDLYWVDLPIDIKKHAMVLGYDENSWDNDLTVFTENLLWDKLNSEQQYAAKLFRYNQETWDDRDKKMPDPDVKDVSAWDDYYWHEIPLFIKMAWEFLGYNEDLWNSDGIPSTELKYWDKLSPDQRKAAGYIGYNQETWDVDDESIVYWGDDDYLFQFPGKESMVSKEMTVYFWAAMAFVIVGFLDWIRESSYLHVLMIFAGTFGVLSSLYLEEDLDLSLIFNSLSVHFFFLEFLVLLWYHYQGSEVLSPGLMTATYIADILFGVGAIMDVVLSYLYFDISSDWNLYIAHSSIAAALAWLFCSIIYIAVTLIYYFKKAPETNQKANVLSNIKEIEIPESAPVYLEV